MDKDDVIEKFTEFLNEFYYSDMISAVSENRKSISVDFTNVDRFDTELADYILENPSEAFNLAEEATKRIDLQADTKLKIRFFNIPESKEIRIRNIRSEHIEKLISVDGIVKRASEVRPEVSEAIFTCPECGTLLSIIQTEIFLKYPIECPQCENRKGFKQTGQKIYDARWIVIEEPFEITSGERPSDIRIFLKEDLTTPRMQNKTEPGNRIKVVGILKHLLKRVKGGSSRQMEIYIDANSIENVEVEWEELEITPEDEKRIIELANDPQIYTTLVESVAPALYGLEEIKEAIALQLFGGVMHTQKDKSRVRGDIHILLVGDPSTAKSVLMKVVSMLIPRGRYVSGKGVTAAGLCTTYDTLVQMEDGKLVEIGKLVEDELKNGYEKINEGFITSGKQKKIIAFDSKNLKLKPLKILKYWKIKAPNKLIKITTYTGKEILLTENNPLPSMQKGEIIWKPASEFAKGDFLATPHKLPSGIFNKTSKNLSYWLGLIAGDGSISANKGSFDIKFHNTNETLLSQYSKICSSELNINPSFEIYERPYFRFYSKKIAEFARGFGLVHGKKAHNIFVGPKLSTLNNNSLASFLRGLFDTDGTAVIERKSKGRYVELTSASKEFIKGVQFLLLRFGIISSFKKISKNENIYKGSVIKSSKKWILRISGLNNLKLFQAKIGFKKPSKKIVLEKILAENKKEHTNVDIIPNIGKLIREIRKSVKISGKMLKTYDYELGLSNISVKKLKSVIKILKTFNVNTSPLENLVNSDIFWDKIKKIEFIENKKHEYVYDVTVEDEHSFVANSFIIHNTATVVKDEEFLGGWVLEAGALVMTNKSLCAIDEFEKVEKNDQVALHEAMEQQTISIAKASIVATLPAQTSILAGGNPKYGRFDPYMPIKEQIDIPETLLSRFDLKFALRDVPNVELDTKVAEHILKVRHYGEIDDEPKIAPELLKKYVAYTRKNVRPKLSREAGDALKDFFVGLREKVTEDSPIPITLRQYEALIRLAEASAKVQLRETVIKEDAVRAINLMKASLRMFGFDIESGTFDIDRLEGRTSASERGKIKILLNTIEELFNSVGKNIPKEEIVKLAKSKGLKEFDIEKMLTELKNTGDLFEPKPGILQKM